MWFFFFVCVCFSVPCCPPWEAWRALSPRRQPAGSKPSQTQLLWWLLQQWPTKSPWRLLNMHLNSFSCRVNLLFDLPSVIAIHFLFRWWVAAAISVEAWLCWLWCCEGESGGIGRRNRVEGDPQLAWGTEGPGRSSPPPCSAYQTWWRWKGQTRGPPTT